MPPRGSSKPFRTVNFNSFWVPLGVPDPLETFWEALCKILTFGTDLGPELSQLLYLMLAVVFLILDILKYMDVYEGI